MSLNETPSADRVHIGFFGKRKSDLTERLQKIRETGARDLYF